MTTWKEEPEQYQKFKMLCIEKNQNIGDVLNRLIRRHILENSKKPE